MDKNSSDTIGNRTRDLPACSAVLLSIGNVIIIIIIIISAIVITRVKLNIIYKFTHHVAWNETVLGDV